MNKPNLILLLLCLVLCFACSEDQDDNPQPNLIIKLNFDPNQQRLDNLGQPATIPDGNAAQTPVVQKMSANYI